MKKIILLLFVLAAFTQAHAQGMDADDETNVAGHINFEAHGKKYVSSKITGDIMGDINTVSLLIMTATANTNGREQTFTVYLKTTGYLNPEKQCLERMI